MRIRAAVIPVVLIGTLLMPTVASALTTGPDSSTLPALRKPTVVAHPDIAPPSAGGSGDGSNSLPFTSFRDGDFIVTQGTLTGHAGMWDEGYYHGSIYDRCVWSANTSPVNGVQREAPAKYRMYDVAYGCSVPSLSHTRHVAARNYARAQLGEPYVITSSKTDQARWYCSKLIWSAYKYTSGVDLDADGGSYVWPIDLVNDPQVQLFAVAR